MRGATDTEVETGAAALTWTKQRDGEEGFRIGFELVDLVIGRDPIGLEIKISVVEWTTSAPATSPGANKVKLTKGATIALTALAEAINECGAVPPASNHIPHGVKCVTIEQWRAHAYMKGISTSDEGRANRAAFQRSLEILIAAERVGVWNRDAWIAR